MRQVEKFEYRNTINVVRKPFGNTKHKICIISSKLFSLIYFPFIPLCDKNSFTCSISSEQYSAQFNQLLFSHSISFHSLLYYNFQILFTRKISLSFILMIQNIFLCRSFFIFINCYARIIFILVLFFIFISVFSLQSILQL